MFNTAFFGGNGIANLEIITYHCLALGFIATSLKISDRKLTRLRQWEIFNTGVTTVSTYLLQAVVGLSITIIASLLMDDFFAAAGMLLPFGYGQGSGQALNYGGLFENDFGFEGGKSFGLTVAALGFLSASIGGVIHLNILRVRGRVIGDGEEGFGIMNESIEDDNEIPMGGSMDKLTVQITLIAIAYMMTNFIMWSLRSILPGMTALIYGFNFLIGVLCATLVKVTLKLLRKIGLVKRQYTNNFLLTRCGNVFFDLMVVAGIAAIRLDVLENYWGVMLLLGIGGLLATFFYIRFVCRVLFRRYQEEQFLAMYGMLTGTASTGIILLREIDKEFKTPAADNLVYQNFPAIVFGFPIMLIVPLTPVAPVKILLLLIAFFLVMQVLLFRNKIFPKRRKKKA
jgi:ESS family glutamate:Na+ symporter